MLAAAAANPPPPLPQEPVIYDEGEVIGSGSFGIIRKVIRRGDGKVLARKEIDYRKMNEREKKQLVAEVNILRELRHPNIVKYYERRVDKRECRIYIVMEYCEGGDLANIIKRCKKERKYLPEEFIWSLLTQLILALHECHHGSLPNNSKRPSILHRDIKPDNVFLDSQQNVKLGDFGLSKLIEDPETEFAKTYVGTPFYMSPELVNESFYNTKSDIWALGCLIYELCALEPPFQSRTQVGLASKIRQGRINPLPQHYSQDLNRMIKAMLNVSHQRRPGTMDLMKVDRIQLCIREREAIQVKSDLKRREAELLKRETILDEREARLHQLEIFLQKRMAELELMERRGFSTMPTPSSSSAITNHINNNTSSTLALSSSSPSLSTIAAAPIATSSSASLNLDHDVRLLDSVTKRDRKPLEERLEGLNLKQRQLYSSPVNNQPYLSSASSSTTPSKIQSRTYSNQLLPLTSDLENRHALPHQLTTISASFSPQPMSTTPILSRLKKEYIGPNLNSTPIIERRRLMREEMERNRLQTPGGAAAVAVSYSSPVQMLISP